MTRFASSVASLRSSEIRDLMSLATAPDIISFAGGMPGNELFPLETIDNIFNSLTEKRNKRAHCNTGGPTTGGASNIIGIAVRIIWRQKD